MFRNVDDASAAIFICILLFAIPASMNFWCLNRNPTSNAAGKIVEKPGPSLLEWNVIQKKMPWGVVILLGGGFSMAKATKVRVKTKSN